MVTEKLRLCNVCEKPIENGYVETINIQSGLVDRCLCPDCNLEERIQNYIKTGEISNYLWIEATLYIYSSDKTSLRKEFQAFGAKYEHELTTICNDMNLVYLVMQKFEEKHWLSWIRQYYQKSASRSHISHGINFDVLMYGLAGRVIITLQDASKDRKFGGAWISLIFGENLMDGRVGIHSLCATKNEAIDLLKAALDDIQPFVVDNDISLI